MVSGLVIFFGVLLGLALASLLPLTAFYGIYFLITLPLRRLERARFFLDLLSNGIEQGHTPEVSIMRVSKSRDQSMGARFHLLAAYLETGLRLGQALDKVPRLLPPQVTAILKTGEEIGDIKKVLPACRDLLRDGNSQMRGAFNYLIVLAFAFTPAVPAIFGILRIFVLPKFIQIFAGMTDGEALPPLTQFVFATGDILASLEIALAVLFYCVAIIYLGGPRLRGWLKRVFGIWPDQVALLLPWRRQRLKRDFSRMLALLLDGGVPESEAVRLAARSTANDSFQQRAEKVIGDLQNGIKLAPALERLDDAGEFRWRLENALHRPGGFLAALSGWLESLDARAFQQEQAASQLITTGLVLFNGLMIGLLVIGMFDPLIQLIYRGTLW